MPRFRKTARTGVRVPIAAGVLSLGLLAACGDPTDAAKTGEIAGLPDFTKPAWRSPAEFSQVEAVRELGDGRLIVLDGKSGLHLVGADGVLIRAIGRKGAGPQEYERPVALLSRPGDTTLVADAALQRFLVLGPSGDPIGTIPAPPGITLGDVQGDDQGSFVFTHMEFGKNIMAGAVHSVRRIRPGASAESLFAPRPVPTVNSMDRERSTFMMRIMPHAPRDDWRLAPDGAIAVVVAEPFHLEWLLPDGRRVVGPTQAYPRVPVPQADRDKETDFDLPAYKSALIAGWSRIDTAGRVWVAHQAAKSDTVRLWSVFGRDGARVAQAPIREAVIPRLFGTRGIYAVRYDDDDVPWLELYPWRR